MVDIMASWLQGRRSKRRRHYKVILLGDYGVGKTSLFKRLRGEPFLERGHSTEGLGTDTCTKSYTLKNGEKLLLDIWDTAGVERYRSITNNYYAYAHAIVLVYDTTEYKSIHNLVSWMEDAKKFSPDAVRILVGNKYDLIDVEHRSMGCSAPDVFADTHGIKHHFKLSAKEDPEGSNIEAAFETIAKCVHYRTELEDSEPSSGRNGPSFCIGLDDDYLLRPRERHTRCPGSCSRM